MNGSQIKGHMSPRGRLKADDDQTSLGMGTHFIISFVATAKANDRIEHLCKGANIEWLDVARSTPTRTIYSTARVCVPSGYDLGLLFSKLQNAQIDGEKVLTCIEECFSAAIPRMLAKPSEFGRCPSDMSASAKREFRRSRMAKAARRREDAIDEIGAHHIAEHDSMMVALSEELASTLPRDIVPAGTIPVSRQVYLNTIAATFAERLAERPCGKKYAF